MTLFTLLGLKKDLKVEALAGAFVSSGTGGGSGLGAASRVLALEASTFYSRSERKATQRYCALDKRNTSVMERSKQMSATCKPQERSQRGGRCKYA